MLDERIKNAKEKIFSKDIPGIRSDEGRLLWYRGWIKSVNDACSLIRKANAKAYMLKESTPVIDDFELLVGKPCYRKLSEPENTELNEYISWDYKLSVLTQGQASHMAIDYEKLLLKGITGIRKEIYSYQNDLDPTSIEDIEKNEFYNACLISLDGIIDYSLQYSNKAMKLADKCQNYTRKKELIEIANRCRNVPLNPAGYFAEDLQSVHFVTVCLEGLYQLGHPDRYLISFYQNDIKKGLITKKDAQDLINCLCIKYNEYIPKGLAVGLMVGGADAEGNDITNELTYMFVESIAYTRMIYPGIGLCLTKDTPIDLMIKSCKLLAEGLSHPHFYDDTITKGLEEYGLSNEEACMYIHSTCVEITPIACSATWVAGPYINLFNILLEKIGATSESQEIRSKYTFSSFDDLKNV